MKSKTKLYPTVKLQSHCWFYSGKKKEEEEFMQKKRRRERVATSGINLSARGREQGGWMGERQGRKQEKKKNKMR